MPKRKQVPRKAAARRKATRKAVPRKPATPRGSTQSRAKNTSFFFGPTDVPAPKAGEPVANAINRRTRQIAFMDLRGSNTRRNG